MREKTPAKPKRDLRALTDSDYAALLEQPQRDDRKSYLLKELVQCSFPYSDPGDTERWECKNGHLTLRLSRLSADYPIPYGTLPRLIMIYVCTKIVEDDVRRVYFDSSLAVALKEFGYKDSTAKKGTSRGRYKTQLLALCHCVLSFTYDDETRNAGMNVPVAEMYDLWWDPKKPHQPALFPSFIEVSERFYKSVREIPVPLPNAAIKNHVKSALELDLLVMLNSRVYKLNKGEGKAEFIPFMALARQYGQEYSRPRDFRPKLERALANIKERSWKLLNYTLDERGLVIHKSPQLVPSKLKGPTRHQLAHSDDDAIAEILRTRRFDLRTREKAKAAAPRWDIYSLEATFWEWVTDEGIQIEKDPRSMFVAFCRSHAKKNIL